MKDLTKLQYHLVENKLVDILVQKTQSNNKLFFRIMIVYYFSKMASMMRTVIETKDRGNIPVNLYAINLASSGQGKGHSTNIIEEQVINSFRERFLEETFTIISSKKLAQLALKRAIAKGNDEADELKKVEKEFMLLGTFAFSFDSGTTAAVKQMRHKLLMAGAGSMNMEIDEIGSNLLGNSDVLTTFLELYDVGKIKQKLIKNTAENLRNEEIDGRTPTNMMLFGTPSKLLNASKIEDEFFSFLETGYARRCLFGFTKMSHINTDFTAEEVYDMLTDKAANNFLREISSKFSELASPLYFGKKLSMNKAVSILLIKYKLFCEKLANNMAEHEEIKKAEMTHRYFKVLKLAGTYAFIDGANSITENYIYNGIKLAEESGAAFHKLLTREKTYIKLAKYIAGIDGELTHADLVENLPFYKGPEATKRELMSLAVAYGYKNNIIIKKFFVNNIEFFQGESLKSTNLDEIILSHGDDLAYNYASEVAPWDKLHILTQKENYNWLNHHLTDGHRQEDSCKKGFNVIVLDVDGGTPVNIVQKLLEDYTYLIYTTKRHTDTSHRFRIVMPINYILQMDRNDYKEFMTNIYEWLPFDVDTQTNQRSRKWLTNKGQYKYNKDKKLLDCLLFIPKTSKSNECKKEIRDLKSLSNIERWFANNITKGNRSNQFIKYALLLVDSGFDTATIQNNLLALNNKLPDKLDETEILNTIMITAAKAIQKRDF